MIWDAAIAEYRAALRIQPDLAAAHANLGIALQAKGDLDEAIAEYRTVIRLCLDYAAAHTNLGIVLKAKGDLDGAIAEYRTALRLQLTTLPRTPTLASRSLTRAIWRGPSENTARLPASSRTMPTRTARSPARTG